MSAKNLACCRLLRTVMPGSPSSTAASAGAPESSKHFGIATSLYREMGMTYWLEKAEAEAAPG
jgi:hypothetical protein